MRPQCQLTRAERRRQATDARTASNLRSIAIAKAVVKAAKDERRKAVLAKFNEFMALTEREPTDEERMRAAAILATSPRSRQGNLL